MLFIYSCTYVLNFKSQSISILHLTSIILYYTTQLSNKMISLLLTLYTMNQSVSLSISSIYLSITQEHACSCVIHRYVSQRQPTPTCTLLKQASHTGTGTFPVIHQLPIAYQVGVRWWGGEAIDWQSKFRLTHCQHCLGADCQGAQGCRCQSLPRHQPPPLPVGQLAVVSVAAERPIIMGCFL